MMRCRSQRLVLVLSSILLLNGLFAQQGSIFGKVVDARTGEGVPFANLQIEHHSIGAAADAQGSFAIDGIPPGSHRLQSSAVGYERAQILVEVIAGQSTKVEMKMAGSLVELPQFTVQHQVIRSEGDAQLRSGSAHYVGPKEIEQFAYTDIDRALRSVPGVVIQEEDGFGLRPNIGLRGAGAERSSKITLMEDGVLAAPAPYSAPAAYYFPTMGRMSGIEVIKGSSQIQYGPNTTGGSLNLISTPLPDRSNASVRIWGGSYNTHQLHAVAGVTEGAWRLAADAFVQGSDGFKQLPNGDPAGFRKRDIVVKAGYVTPDSVKLQQAVTIKLGYMEEAAHETYLGLTTADFERDPFQRYAASALDHLDLAHRMASLTYRVRPSDRFELMVTGYHMFTDRNWFKLDKVNGVGIGSVVTSPDQHSAAYQVLNGTSSEVDALQIKNNARTYNSQGVQLNGNWSLGPGTVEHTLQFGARYHTDGMDRFQWTDGYQMVDGELELTSNGIPGTESNRVHRAQALSFHVLDEVRTGRIRMDLGMRMEQIRMVQDDYGKQDPDRTGAELQHTENTVAVWSPGAGLVYQHNATWQVFSGVHKGFSPPGTDPSTQPERSINYEIGIRAEKRSFNAQVIGFFNNYSQLLGADLAAAGGTGNGDLFNGGKAKVMGLECSLEQDLLRGRSSRVRIPLQLSYTLTDARFGSSFESEFEHWGNVIDGDRIPYIPTHSFNAQLGFGTKRLRVSCSGLWSGAMSTTTSASTDGTILKIPAYTVIDLAAHYRIAPWIEMFSVTQNLLNAEYLVSYLPAGARPGLPRLFQAGVKIEL